MAALIPEENCRVLVCKEMFSRREKWSTLKSGTSGAIYSRWNPIVKKAVMRKSFLLCCGEVMHRQASNRRMLSDVDGGADEALAVHEVVEREGEVRGLLQRPLRAVEWLHVPFSKPDEITGEQISEKRFLLTLLNPWPWWWSSGQRSHLLLRSSEYESCWLLNICFTKTRK